MDVSLYNMVFMALFWFVFAVYELISSGGTAIFYYLIILSQMWTVGLSIYGGLKVR